jgi:aldose 1-epimerase
MSSPSGQQVEIAFGDQRAVLVEVGGGLRSYVAGDLHLLDGYSADEMCSSGRGQVLVPWPNRLQDGVYEFDGRRFQLSLTEPEAHNAIHGLVRWASWRIVDQEPHRVVLAHVLHPQPGYPFSLAVSIEYVLSGGGLTVLTTATNAGPTACPYGAGAHPYLTLGTPTVDPLLLRVPGRTVVTSDPRGLPTGTTAVEGTEYDFRLQRSIGTTVLDNAYTDLDRGEDGLARVELRDPASGAGIALWVDESYRYLMLFTGDPLPDVNRRSLAVEPMTCPPNAFRTGDHLVRVEPGGSVPTTGGLELLTMDNTAQSDEHAGERQQTMIEDRAS